jgi:hypothetical protein
MGALFLAALAVAAAPAAPRQVQARLSIQAIVLPACTVSTTEEATTSARARCTESVAMAVSIEAASQQANSAPIAPQATKVITLTY